MFFFKKRFYLFLGIGERREEKKKRNIDVRNTDWLPLLCAPTRDGAHNPGMCPDRESSRRPFTLQDDAQPTEPYQSGQEPVFFPGRVRTGSGSGAWSLPKLLG